MFGWLQRMLHGRYGNDQLGNALFGSALLCIVLQWLFHSFWLRLLAIVILGCLYFRMFSRNLTARYAENQRFLKWWNPVRSRMTGMYARFQDRKVHRYFTCKQCRTVLRVPRGRGKIEITCPKCKNSFVKKT